MTEIGERLVGKGVSVNVRLRWRVVSLLCHKKQTNYNFSQY